jgi:hypothetical protein
LNLKVYDASAQGKLRLDSLNTVTAMESKREKYRDPIFVPKNTLSQSKEERQFRSREK